MEVKKKVVPLHPQSRNKSWFRKCPDGGIGRRAGLKHQWIHFHPGSTPGLGTKKPLQLVDYQRFEGVSFCSCRNITETFSSVYYILLHQLHFKAFVAIK